MAVPRILVRIMLISITIIFLVSKAMSSPVRTAGHNCSTHHNITSVSNIISSDSNVKGNAIGFVGQEKNLTVSNSTMMKGGEGGKGGNGTNGSSCERCWTGDASSPRFALAWKIFFAIWVSATIALIMIR